jgi:hypothetical protein
MDTWLLSKILEVKDGSKYSREGFRRTRLVAQTTTSKYEPARPVLIFLFFTFSSTTSCILPASTVFLCFAKPQFLATGQILFTAIRRLPFTMMATSQTLPQSAGASERPLIRTAAEAQNLGAGYLNQINSARASILKKLEKEGNSLVSRWEKNER